MTQNMIDMCKIQRTSTTHTHTTQINQVQLCLLRGGFLESIAVSRKTLQFASRQCTDITKQYVDQLKVWSDTYKIFLWFMAHTNTTAKPPRLPAGFNNKYDFGLATTQQQAHKELLQDLQTTIVIYGSHQHNSKQWLSKFLQDFTTLCNLWLAPTQQRTMTIKVPAGFTQQQQRSQRSQTTTNDPTRSQISNNISNLNNRTLGAL